jgi:hypothetical protein
VAILARYAEPVLTRTLLPGDPEDKQSRYIEAAVNGVLVGCIYLPNGNPQPGPKFKYKLAWFERLIVHAADAHEADLEWLGVELAKRPAEGVMAGDAVLQAQKLSQKRPFGPVKDLHVRAISAT